MRSDHERCHGERNNCDENGDPQIDLVGLAEGPVQGIRNGHDMLPHDGTSDEDHHAHSDYDNRAQS